MKIDGNDILPDWRQEQSWDKEVSLHLRPLLLEGLQSSMPYRPLTSRYLQQDIHYLYIKMILNENIRKI